MVECVDLQRQAKNESGSPPRHGQLHEEIEIVRTYDEGTVTSHSSPLLLATAVVYADVTGRVVAVTDGDTIKVLDSDQVQHKVRLAGIDAPERGQPFGTVSRDHLASIVAGKEVRVESTKSDRYRRLLGKVWVQPADLSQARP